MEWKQIGTAPKDGTVIICWGRDHGEFGLVYWATAPSKSGGDGMWCDAGGANSDFHGATHWLPLPELPE